MVFALNLAITINDFVARAAARCNEIGEDFDPQVRPADPRFGDFQANGILPYAKRHKLNPRALGQALLEALLANPEWDQTLFQCELAGPGFVNFRLTPAALGQWLSQFGNETDITRASQTTLADRSYVVDFSSPNTAKEMHVGHIRSTVIGDAVCRLLSFAGAKVIRDNHIGDWGTQFGMLIWGIKTKRFDLEGDYDNPIAELEQIYKDANAAFKESDQNANAIRAELVKLQRGDPENTAIWEKITELSWSGFTQLYDRLGIHFDTVLGESHFRGEVEEVCAELEKLGIAEESEGALVVFHPEHPRFKKQPFIIRKADGASNYATTDLATLRYRCDRLNADGILYVVDARQGDHFEQLFLTTAKWFTQTSRTVPELQHISFGTILGENGKPIKTKEGGSVKLRDLLDEAVFRAHAVVKEKNPELDESLLQDIAEAVGIGSIKYADLCQNRSSDYLFSWERMLALEGNTAPYLLYAVARLHSIFRRAEVDPNALPKSCPALEGEHEELLARKLVAFPTSLNQALSDYRPHFLCTYLFELAGVFSTFYNAEKVIVDEETVRIRRLILCQRTLGTLELGLKLLGIRTLQRM